MRFDIDKWADTIDRIYGDTEFLDPEIAAGLVLLAAGASAGVALLVGFPAVPAALVGAGLAVVGVVATWVWSWRRARGSGDD